MWAYFLRFASPLLMADSAILTGNEDRAARRRFAAVQGAKAAVGAVLAAAFVALIGRPDIAEMVAMAGLLIPAILAGLAFTLLSLVMLETLALASFAMLIGYLVALTGGMTSPLIVWFALIPAEAALAGGRQSVIRAAAAASLALLIVAVLE